MLSTEARVRAILLLAFCSMASLTTQATVRAQGPAARTAAKAEKPPVVKDGLVQSKSRMFTPDGKPIYLSLFTTDLNADQEELANFADAVVMPRLMRRIKDLGVAAILGNRTSALRLRLAPDRLRAQGLSPEVVMYALTRSRMIGPDEQLRRLSYPSIKIPDSKEYVLTYFNQFYNKPEQFGDFILKANPQGDLLRLRDVGEVESSPDSIDIRPKINGRPAAVIVMKPLPGQSAATVIKAVKEEVERARKESFPPGMNFEIVPPESQEMIYAVIETPWDEYPLEYPTAICHELEAIARDIDDVASVSSLAGYDIRTEDRSAHAGTCFIHLKNGPDRKLTPRQIIEKIEETCRPRKIDPECFEPSAISVFVADGGFSVRVLDRTNASGRGPRGTPAASWDDLLNRKDLESVFALFASDYSQHELVINNDMAVQRGASIAEALEKLPGAVGGVVQSKQTIRRFVEDPWKLSLENDRGEPVPYGSFMQFKKKGGRG